MVKYAILALLLAVGCTPQKPPRAAVVMREGTTVRTSCPEERPSLEDPGLETKLENLLIERVCVYGGNADDLITLKVGDRITAANVRESAEKLRDSKRFEDFEIGAEPRGSGAVVYVSLRELPIVEGTGERLDPYGVIREKKRTVEELVAKGYGSATCEAVIEPTEPGHVRVTYKVERGPLWKFDQLVFQNASKLSQRELEAATRLSNGEPFDSDRVQIASMYILDAYYNSGMLTAKVDEPRRDVTDDGKVTLTWNVVEGDVYSVGTIKLGKSTPWMQKELLPLLRLKPRVVFNRSLIAADLQTMRDYGQNKRKKRLEITPAITLDAAKKTVDVLLDVDEKE
jgi:outer membrane protein assembly factor BamA